MASQSRTKFIIYQLSNVLPWALIWAGSATLILFLFGYLSMPDPNYETMNEAARNNTYLIYAAHFIAFSAFPFAFLLIKKLTNYFVVIAFALAGAFTVYVQYFWRSLASAVNDISCADNCVPSVMPQAQEQTIITYILVILISALIIFIVWAFLNYKCTQAK